MTYKQLQDDVLDRLNYDSTVTTTTQGSPRYRVKQFINEWYHRILARPGMSRLRYGATTITLVVGTDEYALTLAQLLHIVDRTNNFQLREVTLDWIETRDPGGRISGVPEYYALKTETGATPSITVKLWPTPAAIATLNVDGVAAIVDLSADADVPVLPADFHYLLSTGARLNEYERMSDDRARSQRGEVEDGIQKLRYFIFQNPQWKVVPGRTTHQGFSRLGAFFPNGT